MKGDADYVALEIEASLYCDDLVKRIRELENRFSHVAVKSINPKSDACHECGLTIGDPIHVPAPERSWFEKAVMAGYEPSDNCG